MVSESRTATRREDDGLLVLTSWSNGWNVLIFADAYNLIYDLDSAVARVLMHAFSHLSVMHVDGTWEPLFQCPTRFDGRIDLAQDVIVVPI